MRLFKCSHCGQPVYFENTFCVQCNATLGFDPMQLDMLALQPASGNGEVLAAYNTNNQYKFCINKLHNVCNWLLPFDSADNYCIACNLNNTIPDLSLPDHWEKWSRIEVAKHRLVYSLLRFQLPVISKFQDKDNGIAFDFKAEENNEDGERLLTGHDNGIITLNIEEADDVMREMAQKQMDEVYRTLLGHFRHEIGHYYWDRLIRDSSSLQMFRQLFGDETTDYGEAIQLHYNKPHSQEWRTNFISAYASAHPWEDWAETWAHYLHIVDTLEIAYSFGISINPAVAKSDNSFTADINIDPYTAQSFEDIIQRWVPLSFVMNSLNRAMGMKDVYPFVINETVKEKLNFIHDTIHQTHA